MKLPGRPTLYRLQAPFELSIMNRATWMLYSRDTELLIEFFGRDREPQDITRQDVKHYEAWLSEKKNYSPSSINRKLAVASSFYNWMMLKEVEGVYMNPFRPIPVPTFPTRTKDQPRI